MYKNIMIVVSERSICFLGIPDGKFALTYTILQNMNCAVVIVCEK
jgi:hypothetical protein